MAQARNAKAAKTAPRPMSSLTDMSNVAFRHTCRFAGAHKLGTASDGSEYHPQYPVPLRSSANFDPCLFLPPLSFINSPFSTKREYEAYVRLPPAERQATVSRAAARTHRAKSGTQWRTASVAAET